MFSTGYFPFFSGLPIFSTLLTPVFALVSQLGANGMGATQFFDQVPKFVISTQLNHLFFLSTNFLTITIPLSGLQFQQGTN